MKLPPIKICYSFGFLICLAMLGFALYLEYAQGLMPCPLCQLQRIALGVIGFLFLSAIFFNPSKRTTTFYGISISLFCLLGALLASRQIYLQHLPAGSIPGACVPGLGYLFSILPFDEALKHAIQGSSDCAEIVWRFLGLNMAEWTFIAFFCLAPFALWQIKRVKS